MTKLKKISKDDLKKKIDNHFFFLKGDKNKRADLSNIDFEWEVLSWVNLKWANFEWSNFIKIHEMHDERRLSYISNSNFEDANFRNADLSWLYFEKVRFHWAILIGAKFSPDQFDETQKETAIFTEEELLKRLSEQNRTIEKQEDKIQKQEEALEQIGEDYTLKLKKWFSESLLVFKDEELIWLKVAIFMFIILALSSFLPIIFALGIKQASYIVLFFLLLVIVLIITIISAVTSNRASEETRVEKFMNKWSWLMSMISLSAAVYSIQHIASEVWVISISLEKLYPFIPFDLICAVFLYFSIAQYSKAKILRVEFQNKLAIIDGYMWLTAQLGTGPERRIDIFLPNISDVLFTKAFSKWEKESNLPVDEILRIVELVNKKVT